MTDEMQQTSAPEVQPTEQQPSVKPEGGDIEETVPELEPALPDDTGTVVEAPAGDGVEPAGAETGDADSGDGGADAEAKPAGGSEQMFTPEERSSVEKFITKMGLPKGVEYRWDDKGQIQYIIPIAGKKYLATNEDVFRGFNLNQAGHQKLNEGKELIGEVHEYFNALKSDPNLIWELAERLGHSPQDLAEKMLRHELEFEKMTPEQKQAYADKTEKDRLLQENETLRQQGKKREIDEAVTAHREKLNKEFPAAMEKHGFSKSNTTTKSKIVADAVGKLMLANQTKRDLSVDDAVFLAKQEWQESVQDIYGEIGDDHILNLVPKSIVDAIRKADLARLKSNKGEVTPTSNSTETGVQVDLDEVKPQPREQRGLNEFFENM